MMCFDLLQYALLLLFGGFRCFVGKLTQIGGAFTYQGKIGFLDIADAVAKALETAENKADYTLADVFETDREIRSQTERLFL